MTTSGRLVDDFQQLLCGSGQEALLWHHFSVLDC